MYKLQICDCATTRVAVPCVNRSVDRTSIDARRGAWSYEHMHNLSRGALQDVLTELVPSG